MYATFWASRVWKCRGRKSMADFTGQRDLGKRDTTGDRPAGSLHPFESPLYRKVWVSRDEGEGVTPPSLQRGERADASLHSS